MGREILEDFDEHISLRHPTQFQTTNWHSRIVLIKLKPTHFKCILLVGILSDIGRIQELTELEGSRVGLGSAGAGGSGLVRRLGP